MSTPRPRFRFAPSPNGELHLGHAFSALKTWEIAERLGGEVLLRIEDIDGGRTREHFVDGIYKDLAWLGLSWPAPVRRQSEHLDDYHAATETLRTAGMLFACTATRKQIAAAVVLRATWPADPDGAPLYPGRERFERTGSAQTALRLDMARAMATLEKDDVLEITNFDETGTETTCAADPTIWGETVIVRKDTPTSYHLSVVVDDALQGITHVTRGEDLWCATDLHVLLQRLLGLPSPRYHHHELITDNEGRKLSKSLRDTSLRHLRESGWTPADVREAVEISSGCSD